MEDSKNKKAKDEADRRRKTMVHWKKTESTMQMLFM